MVFLFRLGYYVQQYFTDAFALSSIGYFLYSNNDVSAFFVNISFYMLFKQTQKLLRHKETQDNLEEIQDNLEETLPYEY